MTTIETLATDLAALAARVTELEAKLASKPSKATGPRAKTAEQVVSNPAVCPFNATSREGKLWTLIGAGKDITRGELVALIEANPSLTKIRASVYAYDYIVALAKKASAAQPAPVAPAPVVEMPKDETPAQVSETPAPVVDLPAAPAPAKRTRKQAKA